MDIDLSPLTSTVNSMFFVFIKIIGIPLTLALVTGFILKSIRIPNKIVVPVTSLLFLYGLVQMLKLMEYNF